MARSNRITPETSRFRVQLDGVDVTHLLTDFTVQSDGDFGRTFRLQGLMPEQEPAPDPLGWSRAGALADSLTARLSEVSFTVDGHYDIDFLRSINAGGPSTPANVYGAEQHAFDQDPAEEPAKLCVVCGYWPEHHNHGGCRCHCQDCVPDATGMADYSSYDNGDIDLHEAAVATAGRDARFAALDGAVQDEIERQRQEEIRRRWAALAPGRQAAQRDGDDWQVLMGQPHTPEWVAAHEAIERRRLAAHGDTRVDIDE